MGDKRRCRYCAFRIANEIGDDVWAYRCGITNEYKGQGNDCCSSYRPDEKRVKGVSEDKAATITMSVMGILMAAIVILAMVITI